MACGPSSTRWTSGRCASTSTTACVSVVGRRSRTASTVTDRALDASSAAQRRDRRLGSGARHRTVVPGRVQGAADKPLARPGGPAVLRARERGRPPGKVRTPLASIGSLGRLPDAPLRCLSACHITLRRSTVSLRRASSRASRTSSAVEQRRSASPRRPSRLAIWYVTALFRIMRSSILTSLCPLCRITRCLTSEASGRNARSGSSQSSPHHLPCLPVPHDRALTSCLPSTQLL
jgi:hypothetical protein